MTIDELIQKANEAYAKSDFDGAMSYLREAGLMGSMNAALDYAYQLSSSQPSHAVEYLDKIPDAERPIVQYHQLLIGFFGGRYSSTSYVVEKLFSLVQRGVIEASLTLLAYMPVKSPEFDYLAKVLSQKSPNIYQQLEIENFVSGNQTAISDDELVRLVNSQFSSNDLEPNVIESTLPVTVYDNVLSPFECHYLTVKFSPMLEPSMVIDPVTGKGRINSVRTSYIATIVPEVADWITRKLDSTIATLTNTHVNQGEALSLLRYEPGQEYKPHYDALSVGQDPLIYQDGGQRVKTALVYLNTVETGGCTVFPKLDLKVAPLKGRMLTFPNADEQDQPLLNSYHAGEKTFDTNKWLVTKWIRKCGTNYGSFMYGNYTKG
ncbi:MAG: 2OG-Fe(II) oxygenase [Pseudomonadota bacterium]|nr:2OG-Fe(II) oxygenase [Pseudomonadota bacterium]